MASELQVESGGEFILNKDNLLTILKWPSKSSKGRPYWNLCELPRDGMESLKERAKIATCNEYHIEMSKLAELNRIKSL